MKSKKVKLFIIHIQHRYSTYTYSNIGTEGRRIHNSVVATLKSVKNC